MKNGRSLQGHRREMRANSPHLPRKAPAMGYSVGCACGWDGGTHSLTGAARKVFRAHLDEQIDRVPILCKVCGDKKPIGEMREDYRHMCRSCFSKKGNEWQRANPIASARTKRDFHLRKKFGMSADHAEELLRSQGGTCAICEEPIVDKRGYSPHVDHDHETDRVRGILCFGCNVGLGNFGDDVNRLRAAADYLERSANEGSIPLAAVG